MRFQTPVPGGTGYGEKGLIEKMFPTVYSLWKVIRKNKTPATRPPDRHRQFPQRPPREVGQPAQAAANQQSQPNAPEARVATQAPAQPQQQAARSTLEAAATPTTQTEALPQIQEQQPRPLQAESRAAQAPPTPARQTDDRPDLGPRVAPAATEVRPAGQPQLRQQRRRRRAEASQPAAHAPLLDSPPSEAALPAADSRRAVESPSPKEEPHRESPRPAAVESSAGMAELEENTARAREELSSIQGVRREAAEIRRMAQNALDEAETLQREIESVMGQARSMFTKVLALNPEDLRAMAASIKSMNEAIRTERQLQRLTRQQVEREAEGARQKAIQSILASPAAVRKASNQSTRELEEARRVAATAQSLKESSNADLMRAEAIKSEAESRMKEEATRLLDEPWRGYIDPPRESVSSSRLGLEDDDIWHPSISEYDLEDDEPYAEELTQQARERRRPEPEPPPVERPRREPPPGSGPAGAAPSDPFPCASYRPGYAGFK